jgi:hypothetical protein
MAILFNKHPGFAQTLGRYVGGTYKMLRIVATIGLSAFTTVGALMAQPRGNDAANQFLAPLDSYNARWDHCEALARKRRTPPGTAGYGDFIETCVREGRSPSLRGRQDRPRT